MTLVAERVRGGAGRSCLRKNRNPNALRRSIFGALKPDPAPCGKPSRQQGRKNASIMKKFLLCYAVLTTALLACACRSCRHARGESRRLADNQTRPRLRQSNATAHGWARRPPRCRRSASAAPSSRSCARPTPPDIRQLGIRLRRVWKPRPEELDADRRRYSARRCATRSFPAGRRSPHGTPCGGSAGAIRG